MSHMRDADATKLCAEHGGLFEIIGGGKTSTKAVCADGYRINMASGDGWYPSDEAEGGAIIVGFFFLLFIFVIASLLSEDKP